MNCDGKGVVLSATKSGAVLLNDSVYVKGSKSHNNHNIWNYSITKNSMSPLSYPPSTLNVSSGYQTLTTYQSELLWIGKCDEHSDNITVFALVDETTHCWKEIMKDIQQLAAPQSPIIDFISAASEGKYLIVVESLMGYQGLSVLIFDGRDWRRIDNTLAEYVYFGETDIVIRNGTIYLNTQVGIYKIFLEDSLATNHLVWENMAYTPEVPLSNLTVFNDHIVVLTTTPSRPMQSDGSAGYICILAYESIADSWLMIKNFECHLCWSMPIIMGLPGGRLLILGVVPDPLQAPQFNILEVTKGKVIYNLLTL